MHPNRYEIKNRVKVEAEAKILDGDYGHPSEISEDVVEEILDDALESYMSGAASIDESEINKWRQKMKDIAESEAKLWAEYKSQS